MSQQEFFASGKKRVGCGSEGSASDTKTVDSSASCTSKSRANPVKIYEVPDAIKIGEFGHMFARVRFLRSRPLVDIRRYKPGETRPRFFHPDGAKLFLSQHQFQALVENADRISKLLVQYGGTSVMFDAMDDNANAEPTTELTDTTATPSKLPRTQ